MEIQLFNQFVHSLSSLSTEQYKSLRRSLKEHDNKRRNAIHLQKTNQSSCPHCASKNFINWGFRNDLQRYKCKDCNRTFNQLTSTPLAGLKKKGRWLLYSQCIRDGFSIRKSAQFCGVDKTTSFRWRHRFLENSKEIIPKILSGIIEADETYFLYSEKGKRNLDRPARKRGGKASQRGLSKEQVCVLVARDRNKNTLDKIVKTLSSKELEKQLLHKINKDILLCTDSKTSYIKFTNDNKIRHGKINLSKGVRIVKNIVHVQNINSYHSRLKGWMRRFRGVATKYLDSYLSWFRELDEFNMKITDVELLLRAKDIRNYSHQP